MSHLLINIVLSGLLGGLFTYISSIYKFCPKYLNIVAFFWGLPLLYFIILYIVWSAGEKAMLNFNIHAIMGNLLTIMAMLLTFVCYEFGMGKLEVVLLHVIILFSIMTLYLTFRMFNL